MVIRVGGMGGGGLKGYMLHRCYQRVPLKGMLLRGITKRCPLMECLYGIVVCLLEVALHAIISILRLLLTNICFVVSNEKMIPNI